jgi:hypothetical protein
MFRIPPPAIAMPLAEQRRHDLLVAARKQPTERLSRPGFLSHVCSIWTGICWLASGHHARRVNLSAARKATRPELKPSAEPSVLAQ